MTTKRFHLGDVLSVTTGNLLSPRGMGGVYDVLNFLTGDNLFTHQLPRARQECKPHVLRQHPQLRDVHPTWDDHAEKGFVDAWLAEQVQKFGETLELSPVPAGAYTARDPIDELCGMVGDDKVIVVKTD